MKKLSAILIILGVITLLFILYEFSVGEFLMVGVPIKSDKVGQLGDIVGGLVGSLWSLASVLLFYSALKEQRNSLEKQTESIEVQRQELKESRKVLTQSAKAQDETQKALNHQLEQMKNTSILQSLNILFNYYNTEYENHIKNKHEQRLIIQNNQRRKEIIKEIDKIHNTILNENNTGTD